MAAPLLLLPLLSTIGAWIVRHLVVLLALIVGTFLLDATTAFLFGSGIFQTISTLIESLLPSIQILKTNLETEWAASANFLAMANAVFPLDFALFLVALLSGLWLTLLSIRFGIFIIRLRK